jgi:hypothetical protein
MQGYTEVDKYFVTTDMVWGVRRRKASDTGGYKTRELECGVGMRKRKNFGVLR